MDNYLALLSNYWYIVISFLIIGFIIGIITKNNLLTFFKYINQHYSLMKKYWSFVIPYSILAIIGYIWLLFFLQVENKNLYLDAFGQILTLIFAIFAGYFAYLQLIESRVSDLKSDGRKLIDEDKFSRAIEKYEQILKITNDDFDALSDLMELYLIEKKFNDFDEKITIIEKEIKEVEDKMIFHILLITKWIIKEYMGDAKGEIDKLVQYVKNDPECLKKLGWGFETLRDTDTYKNLNKSTQKIYNNLIMYLSMQLDINQKKLFEEGNYELN